MPQAHSSSELTQAISWLALDFRVPEDWEIVRHGIGFERGALVFVDRVRQRLSVSWTACRSAPDLDRLLSDFEGQPGAAAQSVLSRANHNGFRLLSCETETGERVSHALYFDPLSNRLIELEWPTSDAFESSALLASFSFAERADSGRVRAFGLDARVPEGFELRASHVKPADLILEFERLAMRGERSPARLRIRRSGMARTWFDGDGAQSMRLRNPELRLEQISNVAVGPHPAVAARAVPRAAVLQRAFGRALPRRVTLWSCSEQNAVFETNEGASLAFAPHGLAMNVRCCARNVMEPSDDG